MALLILLAGSPVVNLQPKINTTIGKKKNKDIKFFYSHSTKKMSVAGLLRLKTLPKICSYIKEISIFSMYLPQKIRSHRILYNHRRFDPWVFENTFFISINAILF